MVPYSHLTGAEAVLRKGKESPDPTPPRERHVAPRKSENKQDPDHVRSWADPWSFYPQLKTPALCTFTFGRADNVKGFEFIVCYSLPSPSTAILSLIITLLPGEGRAHVIT